MVVSAQLLRTPIQGIFLDRDGVINRQRPDYVKCWEEFEFLPGALDALRRLAEPGWPVAVITNQSAVGRGLVAAGTVAEIHRRMTAAVAAAGGRIDGVFVCPHRPDEGCTCRKPLPGLLLQAASAFGLRPADCYLVGDAVTDLRAARAAGCRPVLVRTGLAGLDLPGLLAGEAGVPLVADLAAAADTILTLCGII
jgi:D-glycero-D-manno-heptose 1,7-bisphosphate phosphatase